MKKTTLLFALAGTFALAACGGADDASIDAEADTVEMPADAALEGVTDAPAEDADANTDETAVSEQTATEAADAAADVAAAAEAAAGTAADATE
ncbi:hypothetical protein [Altererythrobacter sp. Z27]|uniref:hypothetical protein n=1 Tax=Altererythrobacter sp. Z27 TaxID=3461147 RepID=UPI0040441E03